MGGWDKGGLIIEQSEEGLAGVICDDDREFVMLLLLL